MAQVHRNNPNQTQQQTSGQGQPQQPQQNYGDIFDPMLAMGLAADQSRAGTWAKLANEQMQQAGQQSPLRIGTYKMAADAKASVGYVAFEYKNTPVFSLVLFESSSTSVHRWNENGVPHYATVDSMVTDAFIAKVAQAVKAECGYVQNPHFISLHTVPSDVALDQLRAATITAHLVASVMARSNRVPFNFDNCSKVNYNFATNDEGVVADTNDRPHRADWIMEIGFEGGRNSDNHAPTLEGGGIGSGMGPVSVCGYVNLRYTGPKDDPRQVQNINAWEPAQLSPELTITAIDAVSQGRDFMLERSIFALGGAAEVARQSGWVEPLLSSLTEKNRKLAALAQHLHWGGMEKNLNFKGFDTNREEKIAALQMICFKTASVNIVHRNGDSLGGLSSLLAEVAYGNGNALEQLGDKLDHMFTRVDTQGQVVGQSFTQRLRAALNVSDLSRESYIATAVPTISGSYRGSNGIRDLDDMDLVYIANRMGDNATAVGEYVTATSYDNRNLEPAQIRLYLMDLASSFLSGNEVRIRGNALNMVMNPVFMSLLATAIRERSEVRTNGIISIGMEQSKLFMGGKNFTMSTAGGPGVSTSYGQQNYSTSSFKI